MKDQDWEADLSRYPSRPFLKEQSIWAIWIYRWGRRMDAYYSPFKKKMSTPVYWFAFRLIETITGVSISKEANIGPGLKIWHFGNIFINPGAVIGKNCTLRQGVTIGNRHEGGPLPVIGNNVELGAYAQILGGIVVADNVKVAAMAVVLHDAPANSTVAGIPAKIVKQG